MIVTLAGHVDHGKSTLIEALTGVATDRLAEEQRRGLTIDLGFAYLTAAGRTLGFVDVPGHHRFIHNMVAGVAAHQHALLVIAADDGPMPQSREHLQILSLLGVSRGTVALSKCDRVPPERVAAASAEVKALLSGTFMAEAPIFETAATTGTGIASLREHLLAAADAEQGAGSGPFRLAVDRVFHLKGAGLVATGTVLDGSVAIEDTVHAFPDQAALRVRGVHVQNQPARRAVAGDRAALNLTGPGADNLERGSWLTARAEPGSRRVVVRLALLADHPRPLRHWTLVHVYHATSHATAHLALLEGSRAEPGSQTLAELELNHPLPVKYADRLVIRDHGLDRTVGGGVVIDNRIPRGRRRHPRRLQELDALSATEPGEALDRLLELGPVALTRFHGIWNLDAGALERILGARPVTLRRGELVSDRHWTAWSKALLEECERRHQDDSALQGMQENEFEAPVPAAHRADVLNELIGARRLVQRAGRYRPTHHRVALSAGEQALLERLLPFLKQPQPPSLGDIGKSLGITPDNLHTAIRALTSKGTLVLINDRRLFLPEHVERLADLAETLSGDGPFTARQYRDAAGLGRNIVIEVLEFFDARGFTRRRGDTRTVIGDRSRLLPGIG